MLAGLRALATASPAAAGRADDGICGTEGVTLEPDFKATSVLHLHHLHSHIILYSAMRRALISAQASSARRGISHHRPLSTLCIERRIGDSAPSSRKQAIAAAAPSTSSLVSLRRTYATNSSDKESGKGKETARRDDDDRKTKDGEESSSSPYPGLEGFFRGLNKDTNGNGNKPRKLNKDSFPFGFSASDSAKDSSESSSAKKDASTSGGSSGGSGPQPGPAGLAPYILPLGALLLFHFLTNSDSTNREITWQEFRTAFLDKGLVDKLTVVNRSKVRVHLHSNATGVLYPQSPAADGRSNYYFSIGSVEAFEKKLDDAQRELNIPSTERVPVAYKDETSVGSTLLSFAPTLLIVGLLYFMSRRAGGAGGGMGGGPGGIFGVGKSKAKMFNVSTSFTRVLYSQLA